MGKLKQKWNLECFFVGGSESKALQEAFQSIDVKLKQLNQLIDAKKDLKNALTLLQDISMHLREMERFILCLGAQDVADTKGSVTFFL